MSISDSGEGSPLFTVIIPVYNLEKYLGIAIESILAQSYKDVDIIIVDDGSTDGCGEIIDDYARRDARIRVIHKENGGLQSARWAGIQLAVGDYVSFLDGDDYAEPDMLKALAVTMGDQRPDMIITGSTYVSEGHSTLYSDGLLPGLYDKARLEKEVYPVMMTHGAFEKACVSPSVWSKWVKRDIIYEALSKIDPLIAVGQDVPCTYPCLLAAESLLVCEGLHHYQYRYVEESNSNSYKKNWPDTIERQCRQLDKIYSETKYKWLKDSFTMEKFRVIYSRINREFSYDGKSGEEKLRTLEYALNLPGIKAVFEEIRIESLNIPLGKKLRFRLLKSGRLKEAVRVNDLGAMLRSLYKPAK